MKKAIMSFAAAVLALAFAFGFAACGGAKESGGNATQSPGGSYDGNGDTGVGGDGDAGSGGDAAPAGDIATAAQWKQAFADTLASKTIGIVSVLKSGGTTYRSEYLIDYVGGKAYLKSESVADGSPLTKREEVYTVAAGGSVKKYTYSEYYYTGEYYWSVYTQDYGAAEEAIAQIGTQYPLSQILPVSYEYAATAGAATVKGKIEDLFAAFVYDSLYETYSAKLTQNPGTEWAETETYKISFKDGKVYNISWGGATLTLDYGEVSIEVPREALDADHGT